MRHIAVMRLPQRVPSIRVGCVLAALAISTLLPVVSRAATQPVTCSPSNLRFGLIVLGQTESQLVVLTNTGTSSTEITGVSVSDGEFTALGLNLPVTLAAGQSVEMSVNFAPTATGWVGGKISLASSSGTIQISVGGVGTKSQLIAATPSNLGFGSVGVGSTATLPVTVTNSSNKSETLTAWQASGSGFSVSGPTLPVTLAAGGSVALKVTFAPQAAGLAAGSVFVSGGPLNIPLSGTGAETTIGQLSIAPTSLNFGNVTLGTTGTQAFTLSASGGSVVVTAEASSNAQFSIPSLSLPMTINAGQSVTVNAIFAPQTAGNSSATFSFASNASNSTATEAAAGTGAAPYVTLSWSPSTTQVSGYNVYRGTSAGTYSRINSALNPSTSYTDKAVSPGATYYYAATAVNSSGEESGYSTPVQVVVP